MVYTRARTHTHTREDYGERKGTRARKFLGSDTQRNVESTQA